jgi:hypothetical protein
MPPYMLTSACAIFCQRQRERELRRREQEEAERRGNEEALSRDKAMAREIHLQEREEMLKEQVGASDDDHQHPSFGVV